MKNSGKNTTRNETVYHKNSLSSEFNLNQDITLANVFLLVAININKRN